MQIKVLTYNIRHGLGMDGNVDIDRIGDVLVAADADIICLQEVDYLMERSGSVKQAEILAKRLQFSYAFATNYGSPQSGMGNAVLTRYPLYSTWNMTLPFTGEQRGLLHTSCQLENYAVSILATHWGLTPGQRRQQSAEVVKLLNKTGDPVILCGDFNAVASSPEMTSLIVRGSLIDAGPAKDNTYPSDRAVVKIDYIFTKGNFMLRDRQIIQKDTSDHLPVLASYDFAG